MQEMAGNSFVLHCYLHNNNLKEFPMANAQSTATQEAIKLVTVALQSGSIKLHGVTTANSTSNAAKVDAVYLTTLITDIAKALKDLD